MKLAQIGLLGFVDFGADCSSNESHTPELTLVSRTITIPCACVRSLVCVRVCLWNIQWHLANGTIPVISTVDFCRALTASLWCAHTTTMTTTKFLSVRSFSFGYGADQILAWISFYDYERHIGCTLHIHNNIKHVACLVERMQND